MHQLKKSSLMDESNDGISDFGTSSNRFMKTSKPKDKFQLELDSKIQQRNKSENNFVESDDELNFSAKNSRFLKRDNESTKRVTQARTPTPKSIATDSDIEEDSGAESFRISGKKPTGMGESGWQPSIKKSPRTTPFEEPRSDIKTSTYNLSSTPQRTMFNRDETSKDNRFSLKSPRDSKEDNTSTDINKWNKVNQNEDNKKKNRIYEDDEDDDRSFGKSNTSFLKTGKQFDNKQDSMIRPKPRSSKLLSDDKDREYFDDKSSFKPSGTTRPYDLKPSQREEIPTEPKIRSSNISFHLDENDEDPFADKPSSSSRFLKGSNLSDVKGKEKKDFPVKPLQRHSMFNDKKNDNSNEEDDDSIRDLPKTKFLKTAKIPETNSKEKSSKSWFNEEENEDERFQEKPLFRVDKTAKFPEEHSSKPRNATFNLVSKNEDNDFEPNRSSKSDFLKSKSHHPSANIERDKENDDFAPKPRKREPKPHPREEEDDTMFKTTQFPRDDTDGKFSKSNFRGDKQEIDYDFKRRSIRFEDQVKNESQHSTRDSSPRKSIEIQSEHDRSRSQSPVTSVCDEFERDPIKQKLEEIKQRRQDRKRQEEATNLNTEHRIAMEAIHTVEDSQSQHDIPPIGKKKITIPLNKKYQSVQSKITTKPNIRSVSMDHLNNILTKLDEPNTDRNYSASQAIREAAYLEWYKAKLKEQKDKKKDAPVEEKDTKEKRNEDDVKATYDAWLAKKKEYFLEQKRKKEEEKKKEGENKENKQEKDNTFEIWKKLKDEAKKKEMDKQKSETKKVERQKMKESEEKKEELLKKKIEWEKRQVKETKLKKEKEDEEKRKEAEKKNKADEKQMLAEISYKTWEEKMDENQQKLATFSKRKESLVQNRRAWRPSSNTVTSGK